MSVDVRIKHLFGDPTISSAAAVIMELSRGRWSTTYVSG